MQISAAFIVVRSDRCLEGGSDLLDISIRYYCLVIVDSRYRNAARAVRLSRKGDKDSGRSIGSTMSRYIMEKAEFLKP